MQPITPPEYNARHAAVDKDNKYIVFVASKGGGESQVYRAEIAEADEPDASSKSPRLFLHRISAGII